MSEIEESNKFYLHTGRYDTAQDILSKGK